jgi:hypothetical protein
MKGPGGIFVLIIVAVAGYTARAWFGSHVVSMITSKGPDCLEVLGSTTAEEEGSTFIVGSFKNNCDQGFGSVTILFSLDRTPGPLGDLPEGVAYAYSRDIKAGEIRDFKTALPVSRNATYALTGYRPSERAPDLQ